MHTHIHEPQRSSHAVVIGGGIAGLLATRVLARHFDRVTLLERDRLPPVLARRPGTPQAAHQHVLLLRGVQIVERLFPGFREEAVGMGAPVFDMAADLAWLSAAGWGVRFPSSLEMLGASRDLLEWVLRGRLAAIDSITTTQESEVSGLIREERRIVGVVVRRRGGEAAASQVRADLVVDASGRHSRLPDWLAAVECARPRETIIDGLLGYASRLYRMAETNGLPWRGAYVQPAPPVHTRGGVLLPQEGNRWHLTLAGIGGDYPPIDEAGFIEFARSLRSPILYDAIRDAEPLTPIAGYRTTENRWRHYERIQPWPEGLIVVGDAACAFNPVYAQGMTTATIGIDALDRVLTRRRVARRAAVPDRLGHVYQRRLARLNADPWRLATSEDLRLPQTKGGHAGVGIRMMHRYIDRIVRLTTVRPDVRLAFLRTMHMLDGSGAIFSPRVIWAVLTAPRPQSVRDDASSSVPPADVIGNARVAS